MIGQGCDTARAKYLATKHAQADLEAMSQKDLAELLNNKLAAKNIKKKRPPIPYQLLHGVLEKNLGVCCQCYDETASVVVHHIKPWATELKHKEPNLAVLCLRHHGEAHVTYHLAQNHDEPRLFALKKSWEAAVAAIRSKVFYHKAQWNKETRFDWVNLTRLSTEFESHIARSKIPMTDQRTAGTNAGFIEPNGYRFKIPKKGAEGVHFCTNVGGVQIDIQAYISQLTDFLADNSPVYDATDDLGNPKLLAKVLTPGTFFCAPMHLKFKSTAPDYMQVEGKMGSFVVKFGYDPWFCLTSSARLMHGLGADPKMIVFGVVRASKYEDAYKTTTASISAIGLATRFNPNTFFEPGYFAANPSPA